MVKSVAKSISVRRERDVWAMLQRHQAMLCRVNERLALKSVEVADLTLLCAELKDEVVAKRGKVPSLEEEVRRLRAKVAPLQEEVRLLKGNLQAMAGEQDESRHQVAEVSLHVDSLIKDLEAERSEGRALRARMGGNC
jgi:chromosome segregation ATPase